MPWMSAVTAISVVVARIIANRVRKLRSLFLRRESTAIRVDSQNDALRRNCRLFATEVWETLRTDLLFPVPPWEAALAGGPPHFQRTGARCPGIDIDVNPL